MLYLYFKLKISFIAKYSTHLLPYLRHNVLLQHNSFLELRSKDFCLLPEGPTFGNKSSKISERLPPLRLSAPRSRPRLRGPLRSALLCNIFRLLPRQKGAIYTHTYSCLDMKHHSRYHRASSNSASETLQVFAPAESCFLQGEATPSVKPCRAHRAPV